MNKRKQTGCFKKIENNIKIVQTIFSCSFENLFIVSAKTKEQVESAIPIGASKIFILI